MGLKVIAFTCCVITVILTVTATTTADWMLAEGWREGLFMQCVSEGAHKPLPFDMEPVPGCGKLRSAGYLKGCAALCIIGVLTDFFGTLLTCLGLKSTDPNKKYKYYRVAIYALILAAFAFLLAVIIYPVQFAKDLENEDPKDGTVVEPQIYRGSLDYDQDGIPDHIDDDDDNDNILDVDDPDDDNDGILDELDKDDDNDGILDEFDGNDEDYDNDGISNEEDPDDDNDGTNDDEDNDDDNDGIPDAIDSDDDNDGILDSMEEDEDGDGIVDGMENQDDDDFDNDGIPDDEDNDDDNDGIDDDEDNDDDGDGTPDDEDNDQDAEDDDDDNDGVPDSEDNDDDNDGVPDSAEIGGARVYTFGYGYGAVWGSIILLFAAIVLLICD